MSSTEQEPVGPRRTGVVFACSQSLTFLGIADEAGYLTKDQALARHLVQAERGFSRKQVSQHRQDVLSRTLLYGGIDLLVPDHLITIVNNSRLIGEGIDVLRDHPISPGFASSVEAAYRKLYTLARRIEGFPEFTGVFSLDERVGRIARSRRRQVLTVLVEEYNFWSKQLSAELNWITELGGDMFRAFFPVVSQEVFPFAENDE